MVFQPGGTRKSRRDAALSKCGLPLNDVCSDGRLTRDVTIAIDQQNAVEMEREGLVNNLRPLFRELHILRKHKWFLDNDDGFSCSRKFSKKSAHQLRQ